MQCLKKKRNEISILNLFCQANAIGRVYIKSSAGRKGQLITYCTLAFKELWQDINLEGKEQEEKQSKILYHKTALAMTNQNSTGV